MEAVEAAGAFFSLFRFFALSLFSLDKSLECMLGTSGQASGQASGRLRASRRLGIWASGHLGICGASGSSLDADSQLKGRVESTGNMAVCSGAARRSCTFQVWSGLYLLGRPTKPALCTHMYTHGHAWTHMDTHTRGVWA